MCGPKFCSMITQRCAIAAELNAAVDGFRAAGEAENDMEEISEKFREKDGAIYLPAS